MIQNAFTQRLNNQVRRLMGDELALFRERVRGGKPVKIAVVNTVFFEPHITVKSLCAPRR